MEMTGDPKSADVDYIDEIELQAATPLSAHIDDIRRRSIAGVVDTEIPDSVKSGQWGHVAQYNGNRNPETSVDLALKTSLGKAVDTKIPSSGLWLPRPISVQEFNGNCTPEKALDLALKTSLTEIKPDSYLVSVRFSDALKNGNLPEAQQIYKDTKVTCPEALELIHTELDKIPWRISAEYYTDSNRMCWLNSWIKIGWWNEYDTELSPQLEDAQWINDGSCRSNSIDTKSFRCVVWEGIGREMILRLVECHNIGLMTSSGKYQTNIELEKQGDYWVPISVAFTESKNTKNVLDLPEIDIGSMTELPHDSLDADRLFDKIVYLPNNQVLRFYNGCMFGSAMCDPHSLSTLDYDSDSCDYTLESDDEL